MWMWIDDPGDDEVLRLRVLPLAMGRRAALAYMGISEKVFRQAERERRIRGRPDGRNGAIVFRTADLQRFVAHLFEDPGENVEFDMDFGDAPARSRPRTRG
jgi:hypothetical protein